MAISITQFIVNLKQLKKDFPDIIRGLLEDKAQEFIKANIDSWNKGLNPNTGEQLTNQLTGSTDYSLSWSATRKQRGLPYDHYYLQFTGDLAHSLNFDIKVSTNQIKGEITIPPSEMYAKGNDLYKMFGDFVGVPKEEINIFTSWLQKELKREIQIRLFQT